MKPLGTTRIYGGLLILLLASGCASQLKEPELIRPGNVALVTATYWPEPHFNAYAHSVGTNILANTAQNSLKGAGVGATPGLYISQHPLTALIGVPLAVVGAALGAGDGP